MSQSVTTITTGTLQEALDQTLNSTTLDIAEVGTAAAGLSFTGDNNITYANPTVDDTSLIASLVPGQTAAGTTVLNAFGRFVNQGTILADGPAGSSFTIAISGTTVNGTLQPGYFFNTGTIQADAGNTLIIDVGSESELFNPGLIVADGGTVKVTYSSSAIAGGDAAMRGFYLIEGDGTLETAASYPVSDGNNGTHAYYEFADSTPGDTLKIDNVGSFGGVIAGFGPGDTVDLGTLLAVGTVAYTTATNLLSLEAANGATLATLLLGNSGTGWATGSFQMVGSVANGITIGVGADGDTILTTSNAPFATSNISGAWQAGTSWAGGVVPGTTDSLSIGLGATAPFTLTTGSAAVSMAGFAIDSAFATVQVTSNATLTTNQGSDYYGTLDITTGNTLTAEAIQMLEPSASVTIAAGATADLAGRLNLNLAPASGVWNLQPGQNPYAFTVGAGTAVVDGSLLGGPTASTRGGSSSIGYESGGQSATVIVNAGGTVTDTHDTLGSDATSSGTLILDGPGASWTDMIDNADTYDTRGNIVVGYNDVALNTPGSLAGPGDIAPALLLVENDATLTEQGTGASIANTPDSAGNVTIEAGGVWNLAYDNATSGLGVGRSGPGTLSVLNGGTVLIGGLLTYLSNGTTATGGGIGVGQSAGASGTILVSGAGSWLSSDDGMSVGQAGQGLLEIMNGGTVVIRANGIGVGQTAAAGASGTIIVGGTGAAAALDFSAASGTVAAASGMTVGAATRGTLIVAGNGTINLSGTGGLTIGGNAGVVANAVVGGATAAAVINIGTSGLVVGNSGTGYLAINSLGTIALNGTGYVTVGSNIGSMGSISVGGGPANALLTLGTTGVTIGNNGTGYLDVADHGTIAMTGTGYLSIGNNSGSKGSVVVAGTAASAVINIGGAAGLLLGNGGTGYLAVQGHGTVNVNGTGYLTIGNNFGSTGSLVVGGATASAMLSVGTAGVTVGNNGTGYLTVNSLGTVNLTGTEGTSLLIGSNSGGIGTVTVNGGLLTEGAAATGVVVGGNNASGTLSLINGGTVSLAGNSLTVASFGASGMVNVQGAGSELQTTGTAGIIVGAGGNGTLAISAGGLVGDANGVVVGSNGGGGALVSVSGGTLTAADITVARFGNGTLNVTSGGKVFLNSSTASVIAASGNSGVATVTGAGSLLQGQTLIVGESNQGTLYVQNGGSVSLALLQIGNAATFGGDGTVAVSGGGEIETGALVVGRNSTLSVDGVSGIDVGSSGNFVTGKINVESGFTLAGNGLVAAAVVNNGVIDAIGGQTFEITGSVSGTGSINLAPESKLKLDQAPSSNQAIAFDSPDGETVIFNSPSSVISNAITGLNNGDRIEFGGVTSITGGNYNNGTITVFTNNGSILLTNVSFAAGATQQFFAYIDGSDGDYAIQISAPGETWNGGSGTSLGTAANWSLDRLTTSADVLTFNSSGTLTGTAQGLDANFNGGPWVLNNATLTLAGAPSPPYQPYAFNQSATSLIVNGGSLIADGSGDVDSATGSAMTIDVGAQVSFQGFGVGDQFGDSGSLLATGAGTTLLIPFAPVPGGYGGYFNIGVNAGDIGQATITSGAAVIEAGGAAIGSSTGSQGTLTVSVGGSLQNTGMGIGNGTGGTGTVTVNGGTITSAGNGVQVGGQGTGVMTVTNGTVTTDGLGIGVNYGGPDTGGSGTLSIQGGGLVIDPSNGINIGQGANGTLIVNGGTFSDATFVNMANTSSAYGIATVGNGGAWLNTQGLSIGNGGFGTLTVGGSIVAGGVNAGTVTADGMTVGNNPSGNGVLAIVAGGTVTDTGTYTILGSGPSDSGTVTVAGLGAVLDDNAFIVGNSGTGVASVTNGGGVNAVSLAVGQFGAGSLTVGTGGVVSVSGTTGTVIGNTSGSNGSLTINAGGTLQLTQPAGTNVELTIGQNGARGTLAAAQGSVLVTGAGALLTTDNNPVSIGQNGGNGSLTVSQGGSVVVGSANFNVQNALIAGGYGGASSNGTVTVTGAGSELTDNGFAVIGRSGSGTLSVANQGTFLVQDALAGNNGGIGIGWGSTGNNSNVGGSGVATIANNGVLDVAGANAGVYVGGYGVNGTLNVDSGGTVISGATLEVGAAALVSGITYGATGTVNIGAGGTILFTEAPQTNNFVVTIGNDTNIAGPSNAATGIMNVSGAGALLDTNDNALAVGLNASGTLDVTRGGVVDAGTGAVDIGSLGSVNGAGLVEAAVVNNGYITGAGGTLELTGAVSGTGGVTLATGSTLRLDAVVGSGQSFTFGSGTPEDLILGTPGTGFTDAIQGLATGDRIEFGNGMTITSASVVNGNTIAADFTAGGTAGVYDLTNVGFAAVSGQAFSAGIDASTGDSYVQVVPTPIASNGTTSLVQVGTNYALYNSSEVGPLLMLGGSLVAVGQLGAGVSPVGAKQTGNGYEVAWSLGSDEYVVWNTDLNGNYTSSATGILLGNSLTLEAVEANFGDGVFPGAGPIASTTTIATNGVTNLVQVGNLFELNPAGGGTGSLLEYQGSFVAAGAFGTAVTPVGAEQTTSGYEVAWSLGGNEYVVWNTDANGNYTSSATGILSGSSYSLEDLELSFGEDLNGNGTVGPTTTPIASNGVTRLVQVANQYALENASGGIVAWLSYQGSAVTAGEFGTGVTPVGAKQTADGYEVVWSLGANEYVVWNTGLTGNNTSSATGVVSGNSSTLEAVEANFGDGVFSGAGSIASTTTIVSNGTTTLVQVGNLFELHPASGTGPLLEYQGSLVTAGEFGAAVTPVGAKQTGNGYEVVFSLGSNEYVVWNTDLTGNYTTAATGVLSAGSLTLEAVEANFGETFPGGGSPASTTTIATNGTTSLVQVGNLFELNPTSGTGPLLEYQGGFVTAGEFGATAAPVGALQTASGYEVVWSLGANEYLVWNTDANGNYTTAATGVLSGSSYALEELEVSFGENLNGDGTIGPTTTLIAANSVTRLVQVANQYALENSSGSIQAWVSYQGSAVTAGRLGTGVTPVGAVQTATGYEVAWSLGSNQYVVWNTDSNGNYTTAATGIVAGGSLALEAVEANFGETFPGGGSPASTTTIATNGTTTLVQVGNLFELNPTSGTGPLLEYQGSFVAAGEFGATVTPVGAKQTGNGYEVVFGLGSNEYVVWNTDLTGNYTTAATGVLSGGSLTLEAVEANFGETFPGGGSPASTTTIATNGTTALVQVGNLFELNPTSGTGPLLEYQGSFVTAGEFGVTVTPVGAKQTGNGYEVAWSLGSNEYVVWNTDANGNYTTAATGVLSGGSLTLEAVEANFGETFPGGGSPASTKTIATNGTTTLVQVGNLFELNPTSGTGPLLEYEGNYVTAGEFGASVTPVGAEKTASGHEVAWNLGGDEYVVWNTDSNGNYTSAATGVVSGESFTLEDLEPAFGEDLNGDGRLSAVLVTSTGADNTLNLAAQTQATTINLGGNTASVSAGLNAPSLAFIGSPDAITLGSSADTIEYALAPSSGIETIAGFILGHDELNIDLMGAAGSTLQLYNTTVGGVHAIAIASSADPTHGLVLLNLPTGDTAADLLASHVTFSGGHALIS
jgi:T5SS/PEP-CTERM-associated repeat protein